MKKLFLSLVALFAVAVTTVNAREVVISGENMFLELGWYETYSQDGVTITCNRGWIYPESIHANFTVSSDSGKPITSIVVECEDYNCWYGSDWVPADYGQYVAWYGSETSVTGEIQGTDLDAIRITIDD